MLAIPVAFIGALIAGALAVVANALVAPPEARQGDRAVTGFGPLTLARLDRGDRLGAVAEAARLGLLVLEILVDLEEVLDLVAKLGGNVVDVGDRASTQGP